MRFSPKTVGVLAAIVTVAIWTSFIVIARATAHRGLTPLDISLLRFIGAALVLLPWGAWLVWRRATAAPLWRHPAGWACRRGAFGSPR